MQQQQGTQGQAQAVLFNAPPRPLPSCPCQEGQGQGQSSAFQTPCQAKVKYSRQSPARLCQRHSQAVPAAAGAGTGSMLAASASKSWSICCYESSTGSTTSGMETVALNLRLWVLTEEIPLAPSRRSRSNTPGNRGILFEKQNVFARSAIIEVHPYKTMW